MSGDTRQAHQSGVLAHQGTHDYYIIYLGWQGIIRTEATAAAMLVRLQVLAFAQLSVDFFPLLALAQLSLPVLNKR